MQEPADNHAPDPECISGAGSARVYFLVWGGAPGVLGNYVSQVLKPRSRITLPELVKLCRCGKTGQLLELGQHCWRGDTVFCCFKHVQCGVSNVAGWRKTTDKIFKKIFFNEGQNQNQTILQVCQKHKGAADAPQPIIPLGERYPRVRHNAINHMM